MKVVELKALAKKHGLRGYSRLKKDEVIASLQNNLQPTHTRPPPQPPALEARPSVRFRPDRPRQNVMPSSRDMDIFEQLTGDE